MPLQWVAHRGFKEKYAENTLEAFHAAVEAGFSAIETDLRCTKDGVIVCAHDPDLKRIAGDSRRISDLNLSEVKNVTLSRAGRISSFEEIYDRHKNVEWTFDIKKDDGWRTIKKLSEAAAVNPSLKIWLTNNCRYLFWAHDQEAEFQKHFPGARFYPHRLECWRAAIAVAFGAPFLSGIRAGLAYPIIPKLFGVNMFQEGAVQAYKKREAQVVAFLPKDSAETLAAIRCGVDEILTDGRIHS